MDAKARLEEIRDKLLERTRAKLEIDYSGRGVLTVNDVMQILLEAGVTLPPQPAGPVTSAATARKFLRCQPGDGAEYLAIRYGLDEIRDDYARDHGLLTPAEVVRRAREWWRRGGGGFSGLVTALTAPAATGEASTASSPPVCASCGERKEKCNGC